MTVPLLVVVTGMPSAGKTTVAEALGSRLRLPVVTKDGLKERLFDTLGAGDVVWSGRLGEASYALLFSVAASVLAAGRPLVVEANFFRGMESEFRALPRHRVCQVHCHAPLEVLLERYASRVRHPGHHDAEKIGALAERFERGAHEPLDLSGDLVRVDTARPVDLDALAERVRGLLDASLGDASRV